MVERVIKPHTGPEAFAAMRQNEGRTTQHSHTPSSKAGQLSRYPQGGTSVKTGPGRHTGPTAGGGEATSDREGVRYEVNAVMILLLKAACLWSCILACVCSHSLCIKRPWPTLLTIRYLIYIYLSVTP